jgi:arylsulfatase A
MCRRLNSLLILLPLFVAATALPARAKQPHASKPNLIVILADDLGASELSCYGSTHNKTPNLDRLAERGVRFRTAFASPVCHPSRFTILTGQYGCHHGVYNFAARRGGPEAKGRGPDDITSHVVWPQLLQKAGYATAMSGKWQLSGAHPTAIREAGFDEHCAWATRELMSKEDGLKAQAAGIDFRSRYWHPSIVKNGEWLPTTADDYGPEIFNDFVIDFALRHKDRPFAVYYPMPLTHGPWVSTPETTKTSEDRETKSRGNFGSNVRYMDRLVGKLVEALQAEGLGDNTVILFTADNGTGGDGKSQATEKGARVPFIVSGPGVVKARPATAALADLSDVLPTLLEFAGVPTPADRPIDGQSMVKFLRGESEQTRDWIFSYQADRRILRTARWLLEDNSPLHYGRLYDCGDKRDGAGYEDVTASNAPEVLAAKEHFDKLLARLPAPVLEKEGKPNERNRGGKKSDDAD